VRLFKYKDFIKESKTDGSHFIPTYEDCVEMCSRDDSAFYESKFVIDGFNISVFNYRLAQYKDFVTPIENRPDVKAYEMRGLTFVFNTDGTLFKRFILLEKFFNINQVPETMYSVVKDYKIKFINNKEDGSIASFIQLPNGKIIGKSKMGFDNEQANGINRIYKTREDIYNFVNWCIENNIIPIFEYVSPSNRIVLKYLKEDLILLRMRDSITGKHIDMKDHLDKIDTIRMAPFEDDMMDLDTLIEVIAKQVDKEGVIVQAVDSVGKDFFFKIKTPWYCERHGLLTNDIYREHIIIKYILEDKIDDILGQIPEDEVDAHNRINKIIHIIRETLDKKVQELKKSYDVFLQMGRDRKSYAIKYYKKEPNFGYVMQMEKGVDPYELAKNWVKDNTCKLIIAREFLKRRDPSLFFQEPDENDDDN
jgi:T4 RnlA family RNA ligase